MMSGNRRDRLSSYEFMVAGPVRHFLRQFQADVTAMQIVQMLSTLYDHRDAHEINHLRGAIGEVYAFLMCQRVYPKYNGLEVCLVVDCQVFANPIDAVGYNDIKGHCLQSKIGYFDKLSTERQKTTFDIIESLTKNSMECRFFTLLEDRDIERVFRLRGIDSTSYKFFSLPDMLVLEDRMRNFNPTR